MQVTERAYDYHVLEAASPPIVPETRAASEEEARDCYFGIDLLRWNLDACGYRGNYFARNKI